jgi:hypothetical protein
VFGKSQCSVKVFLLELWVDYVQNMCKTSSLIFLRNYQHCFSNISNSIYSQFFIRQAVAEHWNLPNTEIFQSKDVASGWKITIFLVFIHNILKGQCHEMVCQTETKSAYLVRSKISSAYMFYTGKVARQKDTAQRTGGLSI